VDWGDNGDAVLLFFGLWGCVTECLLSERRREERGERREERGERREEREREIPSLINIKSQESETM